MKISKKRTVLAVAAAALLTFLFCQVWAEPLHSSEVEVKNAEPLTVSEPWEEKDAQRILFFGTETDAFAAVAAGFGNTTVKTQQCVVVAVENFCTQWRAEDGNLYELPSKGEATGDRAQLYFLLAD